MKEILRVSKEKVKKATNTKNPDPVKLARLKDKLITVEKLYDSMINRVKAAKEIRKLVMDSKLGISTRDEAGVFRQRGAIGDILDALTSGELYDYEVATGENFMLGGHGFGYYNMRKQSNGYPRNFSLDGGMFFRRAEIWAQFFQFMLHQDNTSTGLMKQMMPNTERKFNELIKEAQQAKLDVAEAFKSPVFNPNLPILN